jgi:hypothetical protein
MTRPPTVAHPTERDAVEPARSNHGEQRHGVTTAHGKDEASHSGAGSGGVCS